VVDDEESIIEFVSYNLRKEGYEVSVATDGDEALELAKEHPFDLVVLDVMLPGMDGYEVCRRLRTMTDAPVLFLSARDTELDKVVGLEIGGDDYLAKPFGIRELQARVKALLRRAPAGSREEGPVGDVLEASGITLDEAAHTAFNGEQPIDLTPREFELLATLMRHAGKVLSRDQLLRQAWGWEYLVETKTVDTHVKRLRDKLEAAGVDPAIVETVRGYGYRLRA
jgi:two-component system response regulator RegX3